jgi:hypothetical protein
MSDVEDTTLYEQFATARKRAIEVTDRFNATETGDAGRAELWEHVIHQTETARLLLERWLRTGMVTDEVASRTLHPERDQLHTMQCDPQGGAQRRA